ncbi:putative carboxylic ester hydrolase [Saccharomycopsis crataegensis]|uniref:Carboxylic ester hydrolase n=1 Tax=Saccharomycopsis crataegensis TaxID=43959 RepID=A0AAV5QTK3_9ASCO|nr:putative carboxylic ester hydrolase [Saccharomycopsis crataegensis]
MKNINRIIVSFCRSYSTGTPLPKVRWFYATEPAISKSKLDLTPQKIQDFQPNKWENFSEIDSQKIERAYQQLYGKGGEVSSLLRKVDEKIEARFQKLIDYNQTTIKSFYTNYRRNSNKDTPLKPYAKVPVNEDNLFEADIQNFTLTSIYWDGPVYGIRRGLWFDNEGVPLTNEMSMQIEQGYQALKPSKTQPANQLETAETAIALETQGQHWDITVTDRGNREKVNKSVVYIDENHAYILDKKSSVNKAKLFLAETLPKSTSVVPGYTYVSRGFSEAKEEAKRKAEKEREINESKKKNMDSSFMGLVNNELGQLLNFDSADEKTSQLISEQMGENGGSNNREIEHLVFCIHGIGQILGAKYESINFIHTVNNFRKNLKQNASDILGDSKDCRIQAIPIVWRNLIEFNNETKIPGESDFPTLKDVTIKEIEPLRYLINNTLLDILLYYEDPYKNKILIKVIEEINRSFRKFLIYNPNFNGKVSIIGHSLGSAIGFDILSLQKFNLNYKVIDENSTNDSRIKSKNQKINSYLNKKLESTHPIFREYPLEKCQLDFNVDNYFSIGSPFGLFNLLKKKQMKSRKLLSYYPKKELMNSIDFEKVSFPSCNNFYNVFDSCDPVAYRIEPLINQSYCGYKSQKMTYKELEKQNPGFFNSLISDDLIDTGKNYISEYTGTGLSLINQQFESLLDTSKTIFADNDADKKLLEVENRPLFVDSTKKEESPTDGATKNGDKFNYLGNTASNPEGFEFDVKHVLYGTPAHVKYNEDFYNLKGLSDEEIKDRIEMLSCNANGRVDYSVPQSVYDILIINTLKSHTTYFENEHISKFILNELLFKSGKRSDDWLVDDKMRRIALHDP